ncbi:MAG: uncharacterized protein JWR26_117 [Pedosphaera sp.]|nr:uncharacterized protein [Pedosphaera sp.]
MMITYRSRYLACAEVWFNNEPDDTRSVDWILYHQRSHPVPGAKTKYFYTFLIDLTQSREQLLAQLNKDTAYKIRRARDRDNIICECCDPRERAVRDQFEQMYNTFAAMKGLRALDRPRMESMVAAGVLDLSVAKDPQGNALVYHANYRDPCRATSMELPSLYRKLSDSAARNFIGRANRYLTWSDILRYKDHGLKSFDFGGWYNGNDPEMLKINDYKRGFGGQVVREYQCEQILTLKGWVVLHTANLLKQAGLFPSRPTEPAAGPQTELAHSQIPVPSE